MTSPFALRGKTESNVSAEGRLLSNPWSSPAGAVAIEWRTVSESIFLDPGVGSAKATLALVDHPGKIESNVGCARAVRLNGSTGPNTILHFEGMTVSESIYAGTVVHYSLDLPETERRRDFWALLIHLLGGDLQV